ncbi:MAG: flagellar filament capping protein FliD [Pseudorhodobacter sp.]|nr:flagellar filament capping protein FliD [Frankiaceae bacterium]
MASVITGLGSGVDLQAIVTQLMNAERAPEAKMNSLRLAALATQSAWSGLSGQMTALKAAAAALTATGGVNAAAATSSDASTITTTAGTGAGLGSVAVTVQHLATAQQSVSGPVLPSMLVGAGQAVVSAGLTPVGASRFSADPTATAGTHVLRVTTASAAATVTGTTVPPLSFSPGSDDLTVSLSDGSTKTVTLGSYASAADLVSGLGTALAGSATVSLVGGHLQVSSRDQGSGATLALSGGAAVALGLLGDPVTGRDAVLSLDGGPDQTVTHLDGSTDVDLGGGLSLAADGHLSTGTITSVVVRTSDTSTLADLTGALAVSGGPSTASVFDTGDGSAVSSRFVLGAAQTGSAGALTIEATGIDVLGARQLTTVVAASDARLLVAGNVVTRSSNTVSDLLPGVTLGLVKETPAGGAPTTVGVTRDTDALSTKLKALVDAINTLVGGVKTQTAYNAATKASGPLSGDGSARSVPTSLLEIVGATTGSGPTKLLSQLGVQTTRDGTLTFDSTALATQLRNDPDGVSSLVSTLATSPKDYATSTLDTQGIVRTASASAGAEIKRRQEQIDAFETRMVTLQTSYSAKFAALDAMLGKLRTQQSRLASQISGLPAG